MNWTRERREGLPGPVCETRPTYLLAGGQSSRFGRDKARAPWRGATLLEANAEVARQTGADVTVVARKVDAYADLGLRTIADVYPGCGPLAGIHAALRDAAPAPWVLVFACDLTGVRPSWLEALWAARRDGADAVLFGAPDEQPLLGLYGQPLVPRLERSLESGSAGVIRFLAACTVHLLPRPTDWAAMHNVNSEMDWRQACDAVVESTF